MGIEARGQRELVKHKSGHVERVSNLGSAVVWKTDGFLFFTDVPIVY